MIQLAVKCFLKSRKSPWDIKVYFSDKKYKEFLRVDEKKKVLMINKASELSNDEEECDIERIEYKFVKRVTNQEIQDFRDKLFSELTSMIYEGKRVVDDESASEYAYGISRRAMLSYMIDHTPKSLADLITM